MHKKSGFFLSLLAFPLLGFTVCDNCPKDKVYVQLEDLSFDSDGIWFKNNSLPVQVGVQSLHVDSFGYYVAKQDQSWKCPHCGKINKDPYPQNPCTRCGFPYD